MRLYIANCTQQIQQFHYRVPETGGAMAGGARIQLIDIGSQVLLTGDLNQFQIDSVVAQHRKYGLVKVDEIDRTKGFSGMCYSIDKPVPVSKIIYVMEQNKSVLDQRGRRTRLEAAVAVNQQIETNMSDPTGVSAQLKKFEVELREEKSGNGPVHEPVNEALRVTRDEDPTPVKEQNQARRRRRDG
jgi:hypothetical protein